MIEFSQLKEYFDYLDGLRESGETNMFGAGSYLRQEFSLPRDISADVLSRWMKTFDPDKTLEERVKEAA